MIFKENNPFRIIRRLRQIYNINFIAKGIRLSPSSDRVYRKINEGMVWFNRNFPKKRKPDVWLMYLIFFLSSLKIRTLKKMLNDYAFFRSDRVRIICFAKRSSSLIKRLKRKTISPVQIHQLLEPLSYEVILLCQAASGDRVVKQRIAEFFLEHHHKQIYITGDDLLSLGIKPGPEFKKIFQRVLRSKLNNKINTKKQELDYVKRIIRSYHKQT